MYQRYSNKKFNATSSGDRKIALEVLTKQGVHPPGLLAYHNSRPVGWLAFSPRESFDRLVKSRVIKPMDDQAVWSIVCFFIHKDFRGKGIGKQLIQGAIGYAKNHGIAIIEAYPAETGGAQISMEASYMGITSIFEDVGFENVGETKAKAGGKPRVIMRYCIE